MVAPAFGFSFGDFVTAIGLVNDVRKALKNSGGAKDSFQDAQVDLQHLKIVLEQLHRGQWDHSNNAEHTNAI
jgi:hypothetical protein